MFHEYLERRAAEDGEIFFSFDLARERSKATPLGEEMKNVAISTTLTASTGLRLSTALGRTEVFLCGASARDVHQPASRRAPIGALAEFQWKRGRAGHGTSARASAWTRSFGAAQGIAEEVWLHLREQCRGGEAADRGIDVRCASRQVRGLHPISGPQQWNRFD
jgi:hypothetical protein